MKRLTALLLFCISINVSFSINSIDISNTVLNTNYPYKFTNMGSEGINDQVNFTLDSIGNIDSVFISDSIISLVKPLHIKYFRFPGGTLGNFYHFYGKGNGIDTNETNCKAGKFGYEFPNRYLPYDSKATKNNIEYLKDALLKYKSNGDDVAVVFHLNTHTHFYNGQLIAYTDSVQYLIRKYFNNDTALLNSNGNNYIDSSTINSITQKLVQIENDATTKNIKKKLTENAGFYYLFKENLDAIEYLRNNSINVAGVELGNESFAEYIIYDDDLSYLGYDCTNIPDSLNFNVVNFPLKYTFEGYIKYWIVSSLYADTIKRRYTNIPTGIPAAMRFNYLSLNNNYEPYFIKRYDLIAKKSDLWNHFFGTQSNFDAMIPHFYTDKFLSCSNYEQLDTLQLSNYQIQKIAEQFFKATIDSVLPYNLQNIYFYSNNKPLWITEWNLIDNSFASNTFLHALYNYYFIRNAVDIYEKYPNVVQIWMYHFLAAGYYYFPLIRCGYVPPNFNFYVQKQILYEPFYIWGNTFNNDVKRVRTPFWQFDKNKTIDAFINNAKNELYIQYTNSDTNSVSIPIHDISVQNGNQLLDIYKIESYQLKANSLLSTNYSDCHFFTDDTINTNFFVVNDTLPRNTDSLILPPFSMGKFTLSLKNKVVSNITNKSNINAKIFPNPTNSSLTILLNKFDALDNYEYNIYNARGELKLFGKLTQKENSFSITKLAHGFYLMEIKQNGEIIDNQKIIIN